MQFKVFCGNLSGNAGKVNGIVATLDSEIFARAGSRQANLLRGGERPSLSSHCLLSSTVLFGVLRNTYSPVNRVYLSIDYLLRFASQKKSSVIYYGEILFRIRIV